jgi:magnesium transporter
MEPIVEPIGADLIEWVLLDLAAGKQRELAMALAELHPAEQAFVLESLPPEQRQQTWALISEEPRAEVLAHMREEARAAILGEMPVGEIVHVAAEMDVEDLAEVLETLPAEIGDSVIDELESDYRQRLEMVRSFDEGTVGRLMSHEVVSVREDVSIAVVLRWLRRHESLPMHTDALMVIDDDGRYLGKLEVSVVLTADPESPVSELMRREVDHISALANAHELLAMFEHRDLISVAVLDEDDKLIGRVAIDDVLDLMREESERAFLNSAGLDQEEDLFAPMVPSAKRRGFWLGINLVTVFLAAWVIGRFEEVLDKFVALAVLMPVVASMGGIAGSQTLTLMIRGLALDQIAKSNVRWLLFKEVGVGALNGLVWSLVVALVAYLWFLDIGIAAVIALAMMLNLLAAALSGIGIPLLLRRMGIDPALSGAVVLTTVTDIVGFLSFLGLASVLLL